MEYIYSAMILHKVGKDINEENIKKILTSVGVKPDEARIKALTAALKDVDIEEAMNKSVAVAAAPVAAAAPAEKAGSEKKEEKPSAAEEAKKEEEAAAGLGALFG
ncbi:MAG: 50S ribosomal protein P1 [Candidatus Aenigmarchaeota archaeon]|nr:50S ribosomal protein P1 [Candidatus Aenigmarchaeota archaeon]MCK5176247.1 50S ribosomal protein P1 [Candidatus Aenigmarchaeota archaeon]